MVPSSTETVRETFGAHHRRFEALFEQVIAALRAGAREEAQRLWTVLDRELTAHMLLEEQEMLPKFARIDPKAASSLELDHQEFRRMLAELGASVDLHLISAPIAQTFFETLREHAAREDKLLYVWAEREAERESWLGKLRRIVGH